MFIAANIFAKRSPPTSTSREKATAPRAVEKKAVLYKKFANDGV